MRIVVAVKQIPDLVEELELTADGTDVDREFLKMVVNEFDDQALEEGLCLKEAGEAELVVVALDEPDVDQTLHAALAKGADAAIKLTGVPTGWIDAHRRAALLASWLSEQPFDLVLTGVQAADDFDGQLPGLLGAQLELPHVSVVVRVESVGGTAKVWQELAGGTVVVDEVRLPAVIGVQAARQAPRYVSISRIRQAQQSGGITEVEIQSPELGMEQFALRRLVAPEAAGHAEMLAGGAGEVADRIVELLRAKGLVRS